MSQRFAINGFGRIGRTVFRVWAQRPDALAALDLVAINERADRDTAIHLARFDSTHGRFAGTIEPIPNGMRINTSALANKDIALFSEDAIASLPWGSLSVDMLLECTGAFSDRATAQLHIDAGAKRVLFSQPAEPDVDITVVWGVNDHQLAAHHQILSAGSCTTNALCPTLKVLDEAFGITAGTVTTVHSAMNDQPVLDAYHNTDLRKTRAAFQSIIPVDTGLAVGVPRILPKLEGKLTAHALRVPTLNVSAMDVTVYTHRECTADEVNRVLSTASANELNGVLGFTTAPLASCDFNGETCSSVVDASQTQVSAKRLVKVLIWFDNEWAYANRLIDIALRLGTLNAPTT